MKYGIGVVIYPSEFNSDYIQAVEPSFTEALSGIIEKSGRKNHVKGIFRQRLQFLETKRHLAILKGDWFENHKKHVESIEYIIDNLEEVLENGL